jgi:hypothetical protein
MRRPHKRRLRGKHCAVSALNTSTDATCDELFVEETIHAYEKSNHTWFSASGSRFDAGLLFQRAFCDEHHNAPDYGYNAGSATAAVASAAPGQRHGRLLTRRWVVVCVSASGALVEGRVKTSRTSAKKKTKILFHKSTTPCGTLARSRFSPVPARISLFTLVNGLLNALNQCENNSVRYPLPPAKNSDRTRLSLPILSSKLLPKINSSKRLKANIRFFLPQKRRILRPL